MSLDSGYKWLRWHLLCCRSESLYREAFWLMLREHKKMRALLRELERNPEWSFLKGRIAGVRTTTLRERMDGTKEEDVMDEKVEEKEKEDVPMVDVEKREVSSSRSSSSLPGAPSTPDIARDTAIPTSPANGFMWDPLVDVPFVDSSPSMDSNLEGEKEGRGTGGVAVYVFKPVYAMVSSSFLVLLVYAIGYMWAEVLPRVVVLNDGPFGVQEHAVASMISIAAARGNLAVQTFAVQKLYYDSHVDFVSASLGILATAGFGCGVAGLLESMVTIGPGVVFPTMLPVLSLLKELHTPGPSSTSSQARVRQFGYTFGAAFAYEVLPAYISPLLTGVSVFCLSSQHAAQEVKRTFTNLFGGASGNEGLGLFSLSFDWQFIGASCVTTPLVYQINMWAGYILCYGAVMGIYYSNSWNTSSLPIISTSIFAEDGQVYEQSAILSERYTLDPELLNVVGLPSLTSSSLWTAITANIAFGSLIAHAGLFLGIRALWPLSSDLKRAEQASGSTQSAVKPTPGWWYTILIILSFFSGITVVLRQHIHLSQASHLIALLLGLIAIPPCTALYGFLGVEFVFQHITKMVAAVVLPGRPLAILYFSMWSNSAVSTSTFVSGQMKLGHHLGVSSRMTFFAQLWGLVLGGFVNYVMMIPIIKNQGLVLINSIGLNIWSGQLLQTMNSESVTWSLAKQLYSMQGPYVIVPASLLIGFMSSCAQYALHKIFPGAPIFKGNVLMLPVIFMSSSMMTYGNTSSVLSTIILAVLCQAWLAKAHKKLFDKHALTLGSALDGGAQSMVLVLSLAFLGALGAYKPFFKWAGNPVSGNVDYCNPK